MHSPEKAVHQETDHGIKVASMDYGNLTWYMARQGPPNAQVKQRQHIVHEHAFKGTVPGSYDDTPRRRGEHHQPAFGTSRPPSPGAKIK